MVSRKLLAFVREGSGLLWLKRKIPNGNKIRFLIEMGIWIMAEEQNPGKNS